MYSVLSFFAGLIFFLKWKGKDILKCFHVNLSFSSPMVIEKNLKKKIFAVLTQEETLSPIVGRPNLWRP
jgi:hypothetical protein